MLPLQFNHRLSPYHDCLRHNTFAKNAKQEIVKLLRYPQRSFSSYCRKHATAAHFGWPTGQQLAACIPCHHLKLYRVCFTPSTIVVLPSRHQLFLGSQEYLRMKMQLDLLGTGWCPCPEPAQVFLLAHDFERTGTKFAPLSYIPAGVLSTSRQTNM